MEPNNSGFIVEDELNESDFTDASSTVGMDPKEMVEKIRKLENVAIKKMNGQNNMDQSGMMQIVWQMGEKFGKMEIKMDEISKENVELKEGIGKMMTKLEELKKENAEKDKEMEEMKGEIANGMAKIVQAFEELKKTNGFVIQLVEMAYGLKEENEEKVGEMEEMKEAIEEVKTAKTEENRIFEELKEENGRKLREIDELITEITGTNVKLEVKIVENGRKIEELGAAFNGLKNVIDGKNAELDRKIAGLKENKKKN